MNKRNLLTLVPMLLMTTSAFASPSPSISGNKVNPTAVIPRNNFIDYSIGGESDFSYTCGVEIQGIKPMPTTSLGHYGYVSTPTAPFDAKPSISPDQSFVMAVYGITVISSKDKGLLLRIEGTHHNKSPDLNFLLASGDTSIFLNDIYSGELADQAYGGLFHQETHKQTNIYVSLAGYSLQYNRTFFQTYYGVSYSCLNYNTTVIGSVLSPNTTDTQKGSQSSIGGGIFAEVEAGVILYETGDSAFMIVSRFRQGSEALNNSGSLSKFSTDGVTEVITQTHNSKLDTCSYTFYSDNRLALSYVSKPNTTDPTFFSIEAGVMSLLEQGKNLIHKKAHDAPGDFHTPGVYLRMSYTM